MTGSEPVGRCRPTARPRGSPPTGWEPLGPHVTHASARGSSGHSPDSTACAATLASSAVSAARAAAAARSHCASVYFASVART